jgi:predicted RNA-binding Zn-ribbon protein involved in translation (DUF1610 family)
LSPPAGEEEHGEKRAGPEEGERAPRRACLSLLSEILSMPAITSVQTRAQLRHHHFAHMHPSITAERVADAVERELVSLDNPGFCLSCGAEAEGVEPDAEQYACEVCGEAAVYGTAEILIAIA